MSANGRSFSVPTSVQAVPSKRLIDKPLIIDQYPPLTYTNKDERCSARLDLLQAIVNPDQADLDWQVETILEWTTKATKKGNQVIFKVNWIGGDKQWVDMETLRLHDPYLVVKYAIQHKLTAKPGFEWTKHYLEADKVLTNMVFSYKASRFLKNIKFGVEVLQSTSHALKLNEADGTSL